MRACCCSLAGTAACSRCQNNPASGWGWGGAGGGSAPAMPAMPIGGYPPTPPPVVIDYDVLADKIVERMKREPVVRQ